MLVDQIPLGSNKCWYSQQPSSVGMNKLLIYARLNQGISNEPIYFDKIKLILFKVVFKTDGLLSFHIKLDGNIF